MTSPPPLPRALPGRRVGPYRLFEQIAKGGMGAIYRAVPDDPAQPVVAVKLMYPHCADDAQCRRMFLDEAFVGANIRHPNVCAVLDHGFHEGVPYLVMEYLTGHSLATLLRTRGSDCPLPLLTRVVADVARGLHAAHELRNGAGKPFGVVHRDVSPQNIMVLGDGTAKLLDFGISLSRARLTSTASNQLKGKILYMSPEQVKRERVDRRTDVWSLGVVLWHATLRRRLIDGKGEIAQLQNVLFQPIPRPSQLVDDFSPALEAILLRALERNIDSRTATAGALADELEALSDPRVRPASTSDVAAWMAEVFGREASVRVPSVAPGAAENDDEGASTLIVERSSGMVKQRGSRNRRDPSTTQRVVRLPIARVDRARGPRAKKVVHAAAVAALSGLMLGWFSFAHTEAARPTRVTRTQDAAVSRPSVLAASGVRELRSSAGATEELASVVSAPVVPSGAEIASAPKAQGATRRGSLSILAVPAARVFRGSRDLGTTPIVDLRLPAGTYRLRLVPLDGSAPTMISVAIRDGAATRKLVRLGGG